MCGISRRMLLRDLQSRRDAGVPLRFDKQLDCYSIPGSCCPPPTNFTAAEAVSLIVLAREIGRTDRLPFYDGADAAALKLEGSLPVARRPELRLATTSIRIKPVQINRREGKADLFHRLLDTRAQRRVVEIQYGSLTEWEQITTRLRPYPLLFSRHSWYVIGRSSLPAEIRTCNVGRIVAAEAAQSEIHGAAGFQPRAPRPQRLEHDPGARQRLPGRGAFSSSAGPKTWPRSCGTKPNGRGTWKTDRWSFVPKSPGGTKLWGGFWVTAIRPKSASRPNSAALWPSVPST